MNDLDEAAPVVIDPKIERAIERATAIYTEWRNEHINNIAPDAFARVEVASTHLIAAIAAAL